MSEPFYMHSDRTLEGLPRCKSIFQPSEQETIRCELTEGHEGEHSSQWEWSDEQDEWELPIEAAQMEEEKLAVIAARQEKWAADRDAARREALEEAAVFVEGHPTRNPTRNPNKYHNEDCFHAIAGQLRVLAAASALHKEGELTEQQVSTAICYRQDDFTEHSTLDIPTTTYRLNAALRAASSSLPLQRTLPDEQFKGAVVERIGAKGKIGWMDSTDFYDELGHALGGNLVHPSKEDCKEKHPCIDEPGETYPCVAKRVIVFDADEFEAAASPAGRAEPPLACEKCGGGTWQLINGLCERCSPDVNAAKDASPSKS